MKDKHLSEEELIPGERTQTIPVVHEQLNIASEWVESGKVRISKKVLKEEVKVNIPVISEQVEVERRQVNQYVDTVPPAVRYEGDVTIIPVLKEVLVVEKKVMLVEELHIRKRKTEEVFPAEETLFKEQVIVSRDDNAGHVPPTV